MWIILILCVAFLVGMAIDARKDIQAMNRQIEEIEREIEENEQ